MVKLRDNVSKIEQLKPYSFYKTDGVIRYDFFQMNSIFETELGFDTRGCSANLIKLGFNIPMTDSLIEGESEELEYCDFWHYQLDAIFRGEVRNGQTNTIYVGTSAGIDLKYLKREPNDWQLMMLNKWNELFNHLADDKGKIKVELWW